MAAKLEAMVAYLAGKRLVFAVLGIVCAVGLVWGMTWRGSARTSEEAHTAGRPGSAPWSSPQERPPWLSQTPYGPQPVQFASLEAPVGEGTASSSGVTAKAASAQNAGTAQSAGNPARAVPDAAVVRQYRPNGNLEAAREAIERRFGQNEVRVAVDRRNQQLIVLATEKLHAQVAEFLASWQKEVAAKPSESGGTPAQEPAASPVPNQGVQVTPGGMAPSAGTPGFQVVSLAGTTPEQLEAELLRVFGPRFQPVGKTAQGHRGYRIRTLEGGELLLSVDPAGQFVVVQGSSELVGKLAGVLEMLVKGDYASGPTPTAFVALQRPRQAVLQQALSTIQEMSQSAPVPRDQLASPEMGETAAVAIRGNVLRAGPGAVGPQSVESNLSGQGILLAQAAQVQPAPAEQPQPAPGQAQPAQQQPPAAAAEAPAGLIGPVQIEWLEGLDILIIRGHERDVQRVAELIQEIERLSAEIVPVIQIHQLRHVNCEPLITVLTQIYQQVYQPRLGTVLILALVKPNAILVAGRQESVQAVIDLAQQLDRPVRPETQFKVFRLRHAPADQVAQTITEFYEDRAGLGTQVRVSTDFRSNSLIVEASPRDMAEVSELIAQLDISHTEAQSEIRVFKLKNALASELATILQDAITGQAYGVRGVAVGQPAAAAQQQQERKSAVLRFVTIDEKGRQIVSSGILTDAVITADTRSNSLLVTASPDSMPLIAALIEELDQLPTAEAQIKVFTLVNGDAQNMAEMLQTIFGQQQQVAAQQVAIRTGAQPGESALIPLRFAVDVRTNSIIASGTAGDLALVEAILLRLDTTEVRARVNRVFRLKNSPANDVANALNEFLRSERQLLQVAPGLVSAFEQIEREVVIVPEPVSNSLIVSATPRFFEDVLRLVEELDARPPMVMIQVLIAEVTLGETDEFGVELGLQDSILFDRSVAGTGNLAGTNVPGFLFNTTDPLGNSNSATALANSDRIGTQGLTNFSVGRGNAELGFGGLVLSASSESVSVLIRALQDSRRLEILSRPQIMTMDNMLAQILVGQEVPTISGTQFTDLGGQINTITWREVGLILTVTPRISPDRLVVMEVDATKSEVGPEAEGIPVSVSQGQVIRAPRINTTSARTVVSAADGQTVVLGGLITKSKSTATRKIPVLADIPVVGRLFRFDSLRTNRTELLIILTPHIITNDADVERIKQIESARIDWCLRDVMELHDGSGLSSRRCQPPAPWEVPIQQPVMEMPTEAQTPPAEVIPTPAPAEPTQGPALPAPSAPKELPQ
ncbi:MAG: hypothetical protein NZ899_10160 [Thermoguttaceae bacterium]|nr:hypothetical protein [Thermoguttaceae bacterium]MDW8078049.1 secretin N-terminal domain-containing protein [Thermoguttaceae bacterium]